MPLLRIYVSKLFLKFFYRELKKLSNFLTTFSILNKNFSKTDLLMYVGPFFKYFTVHALQGKEKKNCTYKSRHNLLCTLHVFPWKSVACRGVWILSIFPLKWRGSISWPDYFENKSVARMCCVN